MSNSGDYSDGSLSLESTASDDDDQLHLHYFNSTLRFVGMSYINETGVK